MEKFSDRIFFTPHNDDTDEPYLYFIKGDRYSLQVDTGNSPASCRKFLEEAEEKGLGRPDLAALTHWHWDHTFGITACPVPVIASKLTGDKLRTVMGWEWTEKAMRERLHTGEDIPFCYEKMHCEYKDIAEIQTGVPDIEFSGTLTIDLGGCTAILEQRDSTHTRDSVFIRIPEEGVLIGGDAEYEDYYDNNSMYDPERLRSMIDYLDKTDFKWYLRGHDDAACSKKEILDKLRTALAAC